MVTSVSIESWLDTYLEDGVWDNPRHAVANLITCGFTAEAAKEAVEARVKFMSFSEK